MGQEKIDPIFEILRALDVPKYMDNELKLLCNDNSFLDAIMHAPPGKISLLLTLSLLADSTQDQKSRLTSTSSLYQAVIKGNFNPISIQESSIDESVKADDAAVPTSLWNRKLFLHPTKYIPEKHDRILENLREKFDLRWYRKHLMQSFSRYMQSKHGIDWAIKLSDAIKQYIHGNTKSEIILDGNVGADTVGRAVNADWWNWSDGSTLLFWRWPEEVRLEARDGSSLSWIYKDKLPNNKISQRYPRDNDHRELLTSKVRSPILRRYIEVGFVKNLSGFFCIPKGLIDIRIVYDMTKCGLNAALWSPRFYLPSPDSVFDSIEYQGWMADTDQGEMFLNYFTNPFLWAYMGVDVTEVVKNSVFDTGKARVWMRWNRRPMGVRQFPYVTTRMCAIGLDYIKGNRADPTYVWAWHYVDLNLLGQSTYDPAQPWVCKRTISGAIAPDNYVFVDDGRQTTSSEDTCDRAKRSIASEGNFLGEQDASRKRRKASQNSELG